MSTDPAQVDKISGQTTTGHEWDGIRELNTPLPRWWLWLFYLTIAFSVVYWILYPAWPLSTGFTPGLLGYTNRARVADDVAAAQAARSEQAAGLENASLAQIDADPKLLGARARCTARRRSATIARPAMAPAGKGSTAIPT